MPYSITQRDPQQTGQPSGDRILGIDVAEGEPNGAAGE